MKKYLDKEFFSCPLIFVFGNVHHAKIPLINVIGRFSPDSGKGKWHTFNILKTVDTMQKGTSKSASATL